MEHALHLILISPWRSAARLWSDAVAGGSAMVNRLLGRTGPRRDRMRIEPMPKAWLAEHQRAAGRQGDAP